MPSNPLKRVISVVQKFNLNNKLVVERGFEYSQNPVNAVCELPSIAVFGEYETSCKKYLM